MYRLSYERRGDISFIARETISYFVTSERSERGRSIKRYHGTKNDITGQKTISRDISFLCHHVIAQIKSQECDKHKYI